MKKTIRNNINPAYSLHDMNVIAFDIKNNDIILRTQSGIVKTTAPYAQPNGHVVFNHVQWDFSYVYLLDFTGNVGTFTGEKMFLKDFIEAYPSFSFSVADETYGYNTTKYSGYLCCNHRHYECIVEIYHEGDMVFVDETPYRGMEEVILSHDNEAIIYLVPAEVAANLDHYCWDFAANWVWHGPENAKFLHEIGNRQLGAMFGASDFIDYLNKHLFPDQKSTLVKGLDCYDYEIPDDYKFYPKYNF